MLLALTLFSSSWMLCFALISASRADCSSRRADMSSLAKRRIFHGMSWNGDRSRNWANHQTERDSPLLDLPVSVTEWKTVFFDDIHSLWLHHFKMFNYWTSFYQQQQKQEQRISFILSRQTKCLCLFTVALAPRLLLLSPSSSSVILVARACR